MGFFGHRVSSISSDMHTIHNTPAMSPQSISPSYTCSFPIVPAISPPSSPPPSPITNPNPPPPSQHTIHRLYLHRIPHTTFLPLPLFPEPQPCAACSLRPSAHLCHRCPLTLCVICTGLITTPLLRGNLRLLVSVVARWKFGYSLEFLHREREEVERSSAVKTLELPLKPAGRGSWLRQEWTPESNVEMDSDDGMWYEDTPPYSDPGDSDLDEVRAIVKEGRRKIELWRAEREKEQEGEEREEAQGKGVTDIIGILQEDEREVIEWAAEGSLEDEETSGVERIGGPSMAEEMDITDMQRGAWWWN